MLYLAELGSQWKHRIVSLRTLLNDKLRKTIHWPAAKPLLDLQPANTCAKHRRLRWFQPNSQERTWVKRVDLTRGECACDATSVHREPNHRERLLEIDLDSGTTQNSFGPDEPRSRFMAELGPSYPILEERVAPKLLLHTRRLVAGQRTYQTHAQHKSWRGQILVWLTSMQTTVNAYHPQ